MSIQNRFGFKTDFWNPNCFFFKPIIKPCCRHPTLRKGRWAWGRGFIKKWHCVLIEQPLVSSGSAKNLKDFLYQSAPKTFRFFKENDSFLLWPVLRWEDMQHAADSSMLLAVKTDWNVQWSCSVQCGVFRVLSAV